MGSTTHWPGLPIQHYQPHQASFTKMTFSNSTNAPISHPDNSDKFVEEWKYHNGEILFDCDDQ
jgi:hypothetical protein